MYKTHIPENVYFLEKHSKNVQPTNRAFGHGFRRKLAKLGPPESVVRFETTVQKYMDLCRGLEGSWNL